MKKKLLSFLLIGIIAIGLTGCSNKINEKTFYKRVEKIIASNEELSDVQFSSTDSSKIVYVNDYPTGFYLYGKKALVGFVSVDAKGYIKMMIPAFMAIDKKLNYEQAEKIAKDLSMNYILGENEDIVKNGIKYSWSGTDTIKKDGYELTTWYVYFD